MQQQAQTGPSLTGSLRPWMVILTGVGVLVVAAMLPAARVLLRCTRGCGRNRLRLAATRGEHLAAERCSSAPPIVAAMAVLLVCLLLLLLMCPVHLGGDTVAEGGTRHKGGKKGEEGSAVRHPRCQ